MTIDRSVTLASAPGVDPVFRVRSMDFPGQMVVGLEVEPEPARGDWGDYVRAAVRELRSSGLLKCGLDMVIGGGLPGAGLSSSAAVLIGYLLAIAEINGVALDREATIDAVLSAENGYIGVASGRLDPSVMLHAREGALTVIDCADASVRSVASAATAPQFAVIVAFSGESRSLASSGFNTRVGECSEAARRLLELGGVEAGRRPLLRDVDPDSHAEWGHRLPPDLRRRAMHFFGEMERVAEGVDAWKVGDLTAFGELVSRSGESSIVNYESGTAPLVTLYELLRASSGVFGTRFSGAGFGGTCIAMAEPEACGEIIDRVSGEFSARHPALADEAFFTVCRTAGSVRWIDRGP